MDAAAEDAESLGFAHQLAVLSRADGTTDREAGHTEAPSVS
jgi:hypothetical protein